MEGLVPYLLFVLCLAFFTWTRYKVPGLITSAFLSISAFSIYNLFILAGLPFDGKTSFGMLSLLLFSHLKVIHFFKFVQKYLLTKIYTLRVAVSLAKKKHNIYLYELLLMILIPGSLFIFLSPPTLKEISLLIVLGIFSISALWWLFSNFYLPKLFLSLEERRGMIISERYWNNIKYSRILGNEEENESMTNPVKKIRKDYTPLLIFLAIVGLIICISSAELSYPDFFKNNQLLSFDSKNKETLNGRLNSLKHKVLQEAPKNVKVENSSNWLYYLFPENVSLSSLIESLKGNGKKAEGAQNQGKEEIKNYTLQNTEAFSKMPDLISIIQLSFLSLIPLTIYIACRFKIINALSFSISSLTLFGLQYLLLFATRIQVSDLMPEISLISFLTLLISWSSAISYSTVLSGNINDAEDTKRFLKIQANRQKWIMRQGTLYYSNIFIVSIILFLSFKQIEITRALAILTFFSLITYFMFASISCFCLEKISWVIGRYYSGLYKSFMKARQKNQEIPVEEERVLGINL